MPSAFGSQIVQFSNVKSHVYCLYNGSPLLIASILRLYLPSRSINRRDRTSHRLRNTCCLALCDFLPFSPGFEGFPQYVLARTRNLWVPKAGDQRFDSYSLSILSFNIVIYYTICWHYITHVHRVINIVVTWQFKFYSRIYRVNLLYFRIVHRRTFLNSSLNYELNKYTISIA